MHYDPVVSPNPVGYRPFARVSRTLWAEERGQSIFLALLLLWVFVFPHFLPRTGEGSVFGDLFLTVLLLTGAASVPMRRSARVLVVGIAVIAVGVRLVDTAWGAQSAMSVRLASYGVSAALLAFIVLYRVFVGGKVNEHRILGAVSGYLLLGVTWATLYALVDVIHPGAFSQNVPGGDRRDWIYFSFVTLTTTGYGDITPVHSVARTLAILEALIGQLYPAILIARLVSQELMSRRN